MLKQAKQISKMTNDELRQTMLSMPPIEQAYPILQQAEQRNVPEVFEIAARDPKIMDDPVTIKMIAKNLVKNPQSKISEITIKRLLDNPEYVTHGFDPIRQEILTLTTTTPRMTGLILLSKGTPNDIIESIINYFSLNINSRAIGAPLDTIPSEFKGVSELKRNQIILNQIVKLLEEGHAWRNEQSGLMILPRLLQDSNDTFITEISKHNLHPSMTFSLMNAMTALKNEKITDNLKANQNPGVKITTMLLGIQGQGKPQNIIPELTVIAQNERYNEFFEWIWNYIGPKMMTDSSWLKYTFSTSFGDTGKNLILLLAQSSEKLLIKIIEFMKTAISADAYSNIRSMPIVEELIHMGLSNPSTKDKILDLPKEFFKGIKMTPKNREIVENFFNPHVEGLEELEELMGKSNWYIKYSMTRDYLTQEAGWKDNIISGVLAAIVAIFLGSTVYNAARKYNVNEQEILEAMQDETIVIKAKELASRQQQINKEQLKSTQQTEPTQQTEHDLLIENIITRTIYAETMGEPLSGKMAVASVIYNRGGGNPQRMVKAIQIPKHFSCWNSASEKDWNNMKQGKGKDWNESQNIAKMIMQRSFSPTTRTNHYYNPEKANPSWAYLDPKTRQKLRPFVKIGNHHFLEIR